MLADKKRTGLEHQGSLLGEEGAVPAHGACQHKPNGKAAVSKTASNRAERCPGSNPGAGV